MTGGFRRFRYGPTLSILVSKYLYTTPAVAIREMIANARDQYNHKDSKGRALHGEIYLLLNSTKKTLRCIDYATGIIDPNFDVLGGETIGKTVGDVTSTVRDPTPGIGGQFHMGKASYAKLSTIKEVGKQVISFYSNNGTEGLQMHMIYNDTETGEDQELGWDDPPYRLPPKLIDEARDEEGIGLTVEVHDVLEEFLWISHIRKLVGEQFGILLEANEIKVFIRDEVNDNESEWERINAAPEFQQCRKKDAKELHLDGDHIMTHCLKFEEKPPWHNIKICIQDVVVTQIHSDNKVKGWINYIRLQPNLPRDGIMQDHNYSEMMKYLLPYIDDNFPKQHKKQESQLKGIKDLKKIFQDMMESAFELFPNDPFILAGVYDEVSDIKGNILKKDVKGNTNKQKGPISRLGQGRDKDDPNNPEGEVVIPIGKKRRRRKGTGKGSHGGTKGTWVTDPDGIPRWYLNPNTEEPDRPDTGPIKPQLEIEDKEIGEDKPITYMETPSKLILNRDQPATISILKMQKHYRQQVLGPLLAEAVAEYIVRFRPTPTSIGDYRQMVTQLYTHCFFKV